MSTQQAEELPVQHFRCCFCKWEWEPIVLNPVSCPSCKRRFSQYHKAETFMKIRQKHKPTRLTNPEILDSTEQRSILCIQCQEEDSMSSTYAIFRLKGRPLCLKHAGQLAQQKESQ
jgi:hypothetical protein